MPSPRLKSCAFCLKFTFHMLRYPIWSNVVSIKVNRPTPLAAVHLQIITQPTPCLTVCTRFHFSKAVPCLIHTILTYDAKDTRFTLIENLTFSLNWEDLFTYSFAKVKCFCLLIIDVWQYTSNTALIVSLFQNFPYGIFMKSFLKLSRISFTIWGGVILRF